jgi:hypothetical protein
MAHRKDAIPVGQRYRARGMALRHRMSTEWKRVLDMLEKGRLDPKGRTVTEVWADMVLANPGEEFARVSSMLLPKELPQTEGGGNVITSIQALYLTAVQKANTTTEPITIEHKSDDEAW